MGSVLISSYKVMHGSRFSLKWPPIQDGRQNQQMLTFIHWSPVWCMLCESFMRKAVFVLEELRVKRKSGRKIIIIIIIAKKEFELNQESSLQRSEA